MDNKPTNVPKAAVHYVHYPPEADITSTSYLVPIYEPIGDAQNHHQMQPTTASYQPAASANVASALVPIAYSPQIYHGIGPHIGVPAQGAVGPTGPQMVYAAAASLEVANSAGQGCMVGNQQQQQYITFPMGYPYPYSGKYSMLDSFLSILRT